MDPLYNCRADEKPIEADEFTHLTLTACRLETDEGSAYPKTVSCSASEASWFRIWGWYSDGGCQAVTDANTATEALAVAAFLTMLHDVRCEVSMSLAEA